MNAAKTPSGPDEPAKTGQEEKSDNAPKASAAATSTAATDHDAHGDQKSAHAKGDAKADANAGKGAANNPHAEQGQGRAETHRP